MTNLKEVFGPLMIDKLMANIHLKLYNFAETEIELAARSTYKREFTAYFKRRYESKVERQKAKFK